MEMMYAAVTTEYGRIEWKRVPVPEIADSEVLIKVAYAGICGSDMHIYHGDFQPRTQTPLIQGHEFSGTIVATGRNVRGLGVGDRVVVDPILWCGTCAACQIGHYPACSSLKLVGVDMDGAFAEYVAVKDFMLHRIDERISDRHGALVEVLAIGFHACHRGDLQKNDTVVIWGAGRVGQCILQAARTITDATIFLVDVLENRLNIAKSTYDNIVAINATKENPVDVIHEQTKGRGVDVAFEAVGHAVETPIAPPPIPGCAKSIRGAGTIVALGLGDDPSPLVMKELIWKEAKIVASRVTHGEFKDAIYHMAEGHLHPEVLISDEFSAERADEAFKLLENDPANHLKILLKLP